jgi:hypothetical protein
MCATSHKALDVKYEALYGCDKKNASFKLVDQMMGPMMQHYYKKVEHMLEPRGKCIKHKRACPAKKLEKADLATFGALCQPWSRMRQIVAETVGTGTTKKGSPSQHPSASIIDSILDYLEDFRPRSFMMEQVPGFGSVIDRSSGDNLTYLQAFMDEAEKMGYHTVALAQNLNWWCEMSRERMPES